MNKYLRLALGIGVSATCLFLAFRGVPVGELWKLAQDLPLRFPLFYVGVASVNLFLRAARWRVLLTGNDSIPFGTVFAVNCVGQLGNSVLPARLGDLFRATNLTRSGTSSSFSLATIFVERVFDAGFLVLVGAAAAPFVGKLPEWLLHASGVVGIVALLGLAFIFALPFFEAPFLRLLQGVLPRGWQNLATALIEQFVLGLRSIHRMEAILAFLALTVCIWFLDGFGIWILVVATGSTVPPAVVALLLMSLALSSAIPAAPGNAGVFQVVAVTVLAPFGVGRSAALFFSLIWQALIVINLLLWGLGSLWFLTSRKLLVTAGFRRAHPIPADTEPL